MEQISVFILHENTGMNTRITCPYCDTLQPAILKTDSGPQVRLCDNTDVAGCDRYFVVDIGEIRATVAYYKLEEQDDK